MDKPITPGKKKLLWLLKILGLLLGVFTLIATGWVYQTINEIELKIELTSVRKTTINQNPSILEADTTVKRDLYDNYLLYADRKEVKRLNEEIEAEQSVLMRKTTVVVNEELKLPALLENHCDLYRCMQNRKPFHQIPSTIWKALLGTEDFRFIEHRGVDPIAIARAIIVDLIAMKFVQGGSTLTQQLVKNLFLTNEKKLKRKGKEVVYALYIENILSKEEIITLYLNEVFWGVYQGVRLKGFYSASIAYFNKTPEELNEFEATVLVSFLKGPNFYHPVRGIERIKARSSAVYTRLQEINLVPKNAKLKWDEEQWQWWSENFKKRNENSHYYSYYLASKNSDQLLDGFDKITLYDGIESIQEFLSSRTRDADIGVKILMAHKDCESLNCANIFTYYSKFERDKRRALTEEYHQVGSLFKPMVYESFIELGRSYEDYVSTKPLTLKLKSGTWSPKDYSRTKVDEVQLKTALQKSKNIPLVRVASEVGFDKLEQNLLEKIPRLKIPLSEYPAQLLGALELSLEEVFTTYRKFIIKKCQEIQNKEKEFEDSVLYYMSVASETTISQLAKPPLKFANIFGKTGTSNNGLDNWYFAFDGKNFYVIWFGVESNRVEENLKRVSGAVSSFLIFQNFINFRGKQISEIICE